MRMNVVKFVKMYKINTMKKNIFTALAIASLQFAVAQQNQASATAVSDKNQAPAAVTEKKQAPSAEKIAGRQADELQRVLTLSAEQKQKVYQAALTRSTAMQQLKSKELQNRKMLRAEAKPVKEQFVKDVNANLTPEQQKKWEAYRLEQKQKMEARRAQRKGTGNGTETNGSGTPVKLESQDDGIKDK